MSTPASIPDRPSGSLSAASVGRSWSSAPAHPALSDGAVHVWLADLEALTADRRELLSPEETTRAARFAHERDGELWTRARGLLRELLGRYLACEPRSLSFVVGVNGKPALSPAAPGAGVAPSFNMSHSQHLALYAFAATLAVGVDVEVARRPMNELAITARLFGAAEEQRLSALDAPSREREFLRIWTRHEAAMKCAGTGIGAGAAGADGAEPWIAELEVGARAAGAIAVERAPSTLHRWVAG